jgi:hypothetical protein
LIDLCQWERSDCYSSCDLAFTGCEFACGASTGGSGRTGGGGRGRTSCTACADNLTVCQTSDSISPGVEACIQNGGTRDDCCQNEEDFCLRTCVNP